MRFNDSLCSSDSSSPFLRTHFLPDASKKLLALYWENLLLLTNNPGSASPLLGNCIGQHCIQEVLRPSFRKYLIAHQFTQVAPLLFFGTSLLNISSKNLYAHLCKIFLSLTNTPKKRLVLSWAFHCSTLHPRSATPILSKIFYCSLIHPRNALSIFWNFIAQHCIQEALCPFL